MRSPVSVARDIWFALKEQVFLLRHADRSSRFGAIYQSNVWQNPESASGFGSTLAATRTVREGLRSSIETHGITSILDAPCGDFNWMRELPFTGDYLGGDIVPQLIAANREQFGTANRRFVELDIVSDALPKAELVLCRECLNHLSLDEAAAALRNLHEAASKLLVVTHYPAHPENTDQPASFRYRPLNLTLEPFNLLAPDSIIDESESEPGKVLGVWHIGAQMQPDTY